jgi:hypothetical protein
MGSMLGVGTGKAAVAPVEDDSGLSAACFFRLGMTEAFHGSLRFSAHSQLTG